MTRGCQMILNSFRFACRLRSPGVTNGGYATLSTLTQFPHGNSPSAFTHSSVVEHLLKTPTLLSSVSSPSWSSHSNRSTTPLSPSTTSSPPSIADQRNEESHHRSDCVQRCPSIDSISSSSSDSDEEVIESSTQIPLTHAFIDEIISSVRIEM
ncbi:hypothetical protein PFISCL1PPCAC_15866, partial [Pristionchus fissidentatus]